MNKNYIKIPELLSPAGNIEKLRYAINYGCDAVYLGLKRFGMRATADNFTAEELREAIEFAKNRGVKVYLTFNTSPRDNELESFAQMLDEIVDITPDAFIVADIGVAETIKNKRPDATLHISTQVSTMNSESCKFWYRYGAKRIVLARELSLTQIKQIRDSVPENLELEAFIHGSMCVAYSGRCLMSNYLTSRDANNGLCTQPCRWSYTVLEEKRPDIPLDIKVDSSFGTQIFSSRDLCMIEHIGNLIEAGIDSFKIEGRIKSAYYTAAVTNVYRMALNDYQKNPTAPINPQYLQELGAVSHREYDTGFFFGSPLDDSKICKVNEYVKEKAFLATVESYDSKKGMALCRQRNKMQCGETAMLLSPGLVARKVIVNSIYNDNMEPITSTPHPGMLFYTDIGEVKAGDIIRAN